MNASAYGTFLPPLAGWTGAIGEVHVASGLAEGAGVGWKGPQLNSSSSSRRPVIERRTGSMYAEATGYVEFESIERGALPPGCRPPGLAQLTPPLPQPRRPTLPRTHPSCPTTTALSTSTSLLLHATNPSQRRPRASSRACPTAPLPARSSTSAARSDPSTASRCSTPRRTPLDLDRQSLVDRRSCRSTTRRTRKARPMGCTAPSLAGRPSWFRCASPRLDGRGMS